MSLPGMHQVLSVVMGSVYTLEECKDGVIHGVSTVLCIFTVSIYVCVIYVYIILYTVLF